MTSFDFTNYFDTTGNFPVYPTFKRIKAGIAGTFTFVKDLKLKEFTDAFANVKKELDKSQDDWQEFVEKCISGKEDISKYIKETLRNINKAFVSGILALLPSNKSISQNDKNQLMDCTLKALKSSKMLETFLSEKGIDASQAKKLTECLVLTKKNFISLFKHIENGVDSYNDTKKKCVASVQKFKKEATKLLKKSTLSLHKDDNYKKEFKPLLDGITRLPDTFTDKDLLSVRKWAIDSINRIDPTGYIAKNKTKHPLRTKALASLQTLQQKLTKSLEA